MKITCAAPKDAATILELQKLAYQSEAQLYQDFNIPPLTQTLEELKTDFADKTVLKAQIKNVVVGSVRGFQHAETCHIERLIVHPDFQGQGIGTALMENIETHFSHAQRFELFTGYRSTRNIRLYQRLGYAILKTERINETLSFVYLEKFAINPTERKN